MSVVQQGLAGHGQRHPPSGALQQLGVELDLELADRLAERGLGDVEVQSGLREAETLGCGDEVAQLPDLGHGASLSAKPITAPGEVLLAGHGPLARLVSVPQQGARR